MRGTAVQHPLVLEYLKELDAALRAVPSATARELREQVTGHLEDALPAEAGDEDVAEILGRLGRPRELAAEAIATVGKRPWPARIGWRAWAVTGTAVAVIVAVAATVTAYTLGAATASPLTAGDADAWWYAQDGSHVSSTTAGNSFQTSVPIRPGQSQGFVIVVDNPSSRAQTVLGPADGINGPNGGTHTVVTASTTDPDGAHDELRSLAYRPLPVSVPPHQSRAFRVLWTSQGCLSPGGSAYMTELIMRVRVGWITRTESIAFNEAFGLIAPVRPCSTYRR